MKIIKENGIIWGEEIQDLEGKHRKMVYLGTYNENEPKETTKKKSKKIKKEGD